ncbi:MAG: 50S ribosomal protein L18 [Candidatus Taylorbacteria bacterium]|nr:50S ribosomal protein L18 [Candidatus Taylorbacteria bacterium]
MKTIQKQAMIFERRKARIRAKISGTAERPRLAVFKSHKYLYAQIIDDTKGVTLVSTDSRKVVGAKTPVERAKAVGVDIAKKAKAAKITKVVFDRSGYLYIGKIKVVADAAREGGLEF